MTERFMVDDAGTLIDMHTRDTFDYVSDVCDLLNEQHETIQRLKQNIDELLSITIEKELLEENELLKSRCNDYDKALKTLQDLCERKLKENEQLRTKNNAYIQDIEVFKEENTHLKLENEELKSSDTITDLETEIMKLKEENEQLKKEVEDLKQALIRSAFE